MTFKPPADLSEAIECLYDAFNKYSSWSHLPGCPCCTDQALVKPLSTKRLRDLTHNDLLEYGQSALLTWGDVNDFRHFLPRLFELCTFAPEELTWDTGMFFNKLKHGDWRTWSIEEQKAIEQFLAQWWLTTLTSYKSQFVAGEVLTAIAQAYEDIDPFLSTWRGIRSEPAFRNFIGSWSCVYANSWLDKRQQEQGRRWLSDGETLNWLETGFFEHTEEAWANELAQCIDELEWLLSTGRLNRQ